MVCQKSGQPVLLEDQWSVISDDQLRTAHYEHQVAVVDGKAVILTEA
jgi:methionyl aminopeptidase